MCNGATMLLLTPESNKQGPIPGMWFRVVGQWGLKDSQTLQVTAIVHIAL